MDGTPVAVVTGAGSGIGRAIARRLAACGHRLALVGRTASTLEATARLLDAGGDGDHGALVLPVDLTDRAAARGVIDRTVEALGRLDALVNNAGTAPLAPIAETDDATIDATFALNAVAPACLIARAWPVFARQGGGCVVNVSSMAASDPFPGFFVYGATKAALESLARSIANEPGAAGVRAYAVAPGAVEAPALRRLFSQRQIPRSRTLDPDEVAVVVRDCVLGRRPEPSGAVIRLASPG